MRLLTNNWLMVIYRGQHSKSRPVFSASELAYINKFECTWKSADGHHIEEEEFDSNTEVASILRARFWKEEVHSLLFHEFTAGTIHGRKMECLRIPCRTRECLEEATSLEGV